MSTQFINPDSMMKSPAFSQAVVTQGTGKTISAWRLKQQARRIRTSLK